MHEALAWVRTSVIPLATVEAGDGFADLEPLCGVSGDARIVSLGWAIAKDEPAAASMQAKQAAIRVTCGSCG